MATKSRDVSQLLNHASCIYVHFRNLLPILAANLETVHQRELAVCVTQARIHRSA